MGQPKIVTREEWLESRKALLAEEKAMSRARDQLSAHRRELPWVRIDKPYVFDGPTGQESLDDLFEGRSQLVLQHFMFAPDWTAGCKSCSFWADQFDAITPHLNARDVTLVAVSRAPLHTLESFRQRMGWRFKWLSAADSDFNFDFHASFTDAALAAGPVEYNYRQQPTRMTDLPGFSVFARSGTGEVFHTYSCYSRGLDMLNAAYHMLDLVPNGRDEEGLPYSMSWLRLHDSYGT